jgi:hypothetical protein
MAGILLVKMQYDQYNIGFCVLKIRPYSLLLPLGNNDIGETEAIICVG